MDEATRVSGRCTGHLDRALARLRRQHADLLDALERTTRPDLAAERRRILGEVEQLIVEHECLRARCDAQGGEEVGPSAARQGQPAGKSSPARG